MTLGVYSGPISLLRLFHADTHTRDQGSLWAQNQNLQIPLSWLLRNRKISIFRSHSRKNNSLQVNRTVKQKHFQFDGELWRKKRKKSNSSAELRILSSSYITQSVNNSFTTAGWVFFKENALMMRLAWGQRSSGLICAVRLGTMTKINTEFV